MKHVFDYIKKHKSLLLVIVPALFLFLLLIFPSGTFYCFQQACGYNFWGVHGHDAIWHLAVANVSFNKIPFVSPTFAGVNLYGYNFLLDFLIYLLGRMGIPSLFTYFKLFPVVWFVVFTFLLLRLARKLKDDSLFVWLFLFFSYFAGSFSYFLTLYHHGTINGSSTLLPQPVMHMMSNLPYAFSLLFFLALLIFIKDRRFTLKSTIFSGLCIVVIMGLKFYGGVISIFMMIVYLLLTTVKKNVKDFIIYSAVLGLFVIAGAFLFYDPLESLKTGSVLGIAPFALVHTITEETNQFYLRGMTDARYYLMKHGGSGRRLIFIESINLFVFLLFYLGTRFFGFFYFAVWAVRKKLDTFDVTVMATTFFSILLTVLLVQKAEWWNTIQFFFYAIFLMTIYLTKLTYELIRTKKAVPVLAALILIILSVPTSWDLVRLFAVTPGATYVPQEEMKALQFLKTQPDGVVLTPLYNKEWKSYVKTNPLYRYEDTAYVAAFTGKQVYFANILQLRLTGVPYQTRLAKIQRHDCSILNEVDYIYEIRVLEDKEKFLSCYQNRVKKIFDSGSIFIYSVSKK